MVEEESKTENIVALKLVKNVHAMLTILAFLSRSKKFLAQGVSRAFRDHIAFKSLISVRFIGHAVITNSTLLTSVIQKTRKVQKL